MPPGTAEARRCAVVRVTRAAASHAAGADLRVAVAGGVDSGKSSLVGVLTTGALDNGRGRSRTAVLRHKHELQSGRTSSISLQACAYDAAGRALSHAPALGGLSHAELAASAARTVRFFDLGGHERYSKTMLHGLTTLLPDCVLLCVSAASGEGQRCGWGVVGSKAARAFQPALPCAAACCICHPTSRVLPLCRLQACHGPHGSIWRQPWPSGYPWRWR